MKRILGIHLLLLALLVSCSEEEFFEKDFLETFQDIAGYRTDTFTQQDGNNKIDILWVVDNSGSMGNEQAALASNFNVFIQDFITKDVDFQMAIATTDNDGNPVSGSIEALTRQKLLDDQAQFVSDFQSMIQVGTSGSGNERGLRSSELFTQNYAVNHFRPDAYYIVVYVSDEYDQSPKTPQEYVDALGAWKTQSQLVKAYSIVNMDPGYQYGYARYDYVSTQTNGVTSDINADFHQTLSDIGEGIASLAFSFVLSTPVTDVSTIKVYINGIRTTSGWTYDQGNNAIEFTESTAPPAGATIKVKYKWQEEGEE